MDYRNNPGSDRKRLLDFLVTYVLKQVKDCNTQDTLLIIAPEIELSPDSLDLYGSYSVFLGANRRKLLEDFLRLEWPGGVVVQLEIDYEVRIHISCVGNALYENE